MSGDDMPPLDDRALAAVDLIGRTGAKGLSFGYARDNAPSIAEADWYAEAHYQGTRVITEHHGHPGAALHALAVRLLTGAKCAHCEGLISLGGGGAVFYPGASTLPGQKLLTEAQARSRPLCRWRLAGPKWVRGCA